MMENDFPAIKPVENLQNVASLTPAGQQQERKRRPAPRRPGQKPDAKPADEAPTPGTAEIDKDPHTIDYRA